MVSRLNHGKSYILVFIGTVGSGKSTHIKYLALYLKRQGERVKPTYLKTYFLLTKNLLHAFGNLGISVRNLYRIHRLLVMLDLIINTFVLPFLSLIRVKLASKLFKYVLVEEYLPGILVDYIHAMITLKLSRELVMRLMSILFKMLYSRNLITFILTCDSALLPHRWKIRNSPPEIQSYLEVQKNVFACWSKCMSNVFKISTTDRSIEETNREIRAILYKYGVAKNL